MNIQVIPDEVQEKFPIGSFKVCEVSSIPYFGVFVKLNGTNIRGFIDLLEFKYNPRKELKIGSSLEVVVLQYRERTKDSQIRFGLAENRCEFLLKTHQKILSQLPNQK